MSKPLSQMSDSEFFIECSKVLSCMCDRIKTTHENACDIAKLGDDALMRPMLECSMYTCLEGVADILNGIDLVDESAEQSAPVFAELHRRFPFSI